MKVKNMRHKFLCLAVASAMAIALLANPVQVKAAEEKYISELTGLPIDKSLQNQRPIAVMVDNEKIALKHYGIAEADIVYEMTGEKDLELTEAKLIPMYILTNKKMRNGAGQMLNSNILKEAGNIIGKDFMILPSGVITPKSIR